MTLHLTLKNFISFVVGVCVVTLAAISVLVSTDDLKSWRIPIIVLAIIAVMGLLVQMFLQSRDDAVQQKRDVALAKIAVKEYIEAVSSLQPVVRPEMQAANRPKLFLEYSSAVAAKYGMTYSGLFLKNDGERAFKIHFEPEIRCKLTLEMDDPPGTVEAGTPHPVIFQFSTVDNTGSKHPTGGLLSSRMQNLFVALFEEGEDRFEIGIHCTDYDGQKFYSKTVLRYDHWTHEISSELA